MATLRAQATSGPQTLAHRLRRAAVPLMAVAVVLAGCGAPQTGSPSSPTPTGTPASQTPAVSPAATGASTCDLPALPRAGTTPPGGLPGLALAGPALTALHGGPVLSSFTLDGGDLTVAPPRPGDRPTVPERQAECTALASVNTDGASLVGAALQSGIAIGYGRVTVAPQILSQYHRPPTYAAMTRPARLPAPAAYRQRLAWVVVVKENFAYSCPAMTVSPQTRTTPAAPAALPTDHGYGVFLQDARTGGDALLYVEGYPAPCGGPGRVAPSVAVPAEQVSVPWALLSRNPDGYSARIRATVQPCDAYPNTVLVSRYSPSVRVTVLRPVDAACGAPEAVTLALHASTVTTDLPAHIAHAAVGPYVPVPSSHPAAPPPSSAGVLRNLGPTDSGTTITVSAGTVLVVTPFPGIAPTGASPVVSSDTAVLGPLDGPNRQPVAEFRAWKTGAAQLSIPTSACVSPQTKTPPCSGGPWVVRVDVTAPAPAGGA